MAEAAEAVQVEPTLKERMTALRDSFIIAVKGYKEAGKAGNEELKAQQYEIAINCKDEYAALVKEHGCGKPVLVKMNSNLANIDRGAKPATAPAEPTEKAETPKPKTKAKPKAKSKTAEKLAEKKADPPKPTKGKTLPKTVSSDDI